MKNLLLPRDCDQMIDRINKINPSGKPAFGRLTVDGMLFHCNRISEAILTGSSEKKPTTRQKFLRILVLNLMQKLPKGRHSSSRFFSQEEHLSFVYEKQKLIETIKQFPLNNKLLGGEHPVFGKMNTGQWGRFAWIHLDHHLRQFGV